jgi:KUP system potassium uptake protein
MRIMRGCARRRAGASRLSLTALGVVYGDIGTSPLYTVKEAFGARHGLLPTVPNVYGIMSLVFWSIMLVVTVKYLIFILQADNHSEGGVLALLALVLQRQHRTDDRRRRAMYYHPRRVRHGPALRRRHHHAGHLGAQRSRRPGDRRPALSHVIVPATIGILLLLFMVQR